MAENAVLVVVMTLLNGKEKEKETDLCSAPPPPSYEWFLSFVLDLIDVAPDLPYRCLLTVAPCVIFFVITTNSYFMKRQPMMEVVAPANMAEGFELQVQIGADTYMVKVVRELPHFVSE